MAAPNNARCPLCKAKLQKRVGIGTSYTCNRCGYQKSEEPDNWTKKCFQSHLSQREGSLWRIGFIIKENLETGKSFLR